MLHEVAALGRDLLPQLEEGGELDAREEDRRGRVVRALAERRRRPVPRAARDRLERERAARGAVVREDEDRGRRDRVGQQREERRRVRGGAGRDDEKDVRHRGREQRAGFLERARDEDFGARFLERAPNGLRHFAARAKEEEGPHARDVSAKDGTGAPGGRQAGRYTFSMRIDAALVSKVAALAALELTDAERDALAGQLTRIVEHFEALREVPEALLAKATWPRRATPLRADVARDGSPGPLVEANAPEFAHGHFVVPRVVTRD